MVGHPFIDETLALLKNFPKKEFIHKLKYLTDNILNISMKQERVCDITYDIIPKLFALEDNDLYISFLDISKHDNECNEFYQSLMNEDDDYIFDEFLFMTVSFLKFVFTSIDQIDKLIFINNYKDKKVKIISRDGMNKFVHNNLDLYDEDHIGSINLNIPIH